MKKYELIKSVLAVDKDTKKLIRLKKGTIYIDHERINIFKQKKMLLCKKYEEIQKNVFDCFDCVVIPRNELSLYFKEVKE